MTLIGRILSTWSLCGVFLAASLFIAYPSVTFAQTEGTSEEEAPAQEEAAGRDTLNIGVGFQSSFPAYGLSAMFDVAESTSLQAIVGPFGNLKTYAGRGLFRFLQETFHNLYGYAMVGGWTYGAFGVSETVAGFGAGVGIEGDWRGLAPDDDLPPLFFNAELGLGVVNFDEVAYNFSALMLGVGVHYRF